MPRKSCVQRTRLISRRIFLGAEYASIWRMRSTSTWGQSSMGCGEEDGGTEEGGVEGQNSRGGKEGGKEGKGEEGEEEVAEEEELVRAPLRRMRRARWRGRAQVGATRR